MGASHLYVIRKSYLIKSPLSSAKFCQFSSPQFKVLIFALFLIHYILKYMNFLMNMLIIKPLSGEWWDDDPLFEIFTKSAPPILAFELEADLVEWVLNKLVLIPACLRVFLSQPGIVQDRTALWGLFKLKSNYFSWLDSFHGLELLIYSFNVSTTHNALSSPQVK